MKNNQKGFSLIELILVVSMIGIIAAIAVPSLTKAVAAAENGSTVATYENHSISSINHFFTKKQIWKSGRSKSVSKQQSRTS